MLRFLVILCLGLLPAEVTSAQESVTIDLGPTEEVKALYSYPNNCAEVCFSPEPGTLLDTIKKYLTDSLRRDGHATTEVRPFESDGRIGVRIVGDGATDYAKILPKYLEAGRLGLKGARELLKPDPDNENRILWRFNWRFFLPHGVAMTQHHTVQLLHFPPDTVLLAEQDYLAASTTERWAELLKENGAPKDTVDRFQNIIDIAPIAAPHKDGEKLSGDKNCKNCKGVYPHFNDYIKALLELWLPLPAPGSSRPLVAFGGPARDWLNSAYNVTLKVPKFDVVTLGSGLKVNALGANHPSFIWAAVQYVKDDPFTPKDEPLGVAMKIMRQDLVAACWQVKMISSAGSIDPKNILSECEKKWAYNVTEKSDAVLNAGPFVRVCELSYEQVFRKSENDAKCLCGNLGAGKIIDKALTVSEEEIEALRQAIGANEASVEPEGEAEGSAMRR
jgi:hypothetical protein